MTYATLDSLTDRFGERMLIDLTDRGDPPAGAVAAEVVGRAIADTDALIDGYLAARYVLPLAEVPPLLRDLALTIAIYKLHVYDPPQKIAKDHEMAIRALEAIAAGRIRLPVAGIDPPGTGGSGARITDRARPMTETNLKGFI